MGYLKKSSIVALTILSLSLTSSQAVAGFLVRDLFSPGDGLLTFDEESGLEWLDLTRTQNLPFSEVNSLIGPGAIYQGFRVATDQEVMGLLAHVKIPVPTNLDIFTNFPFAPGNQFIDFFGQTGLIGWPSERASAGIVRGDSGSNVFMYEVQAGQLGEPQPFARIRKMFTGQQSTGGFGIFLTRNAVSAMKVGIDIKPWRRPNEINPKSKEKISVAILSTKAFNALRQINLNSLTFGRTGDEQSLAFCHGSEDVNRDGLQDLVCHFFPEYTGFQCGDTEGILKGETVQGIPFKGSDSVEIVPCK